MFEDLLQKIMDWIWRHRDMAKGIFGFILISSFVVLWETFRAKRKEQEDQEPEFEEVVRGGDQPDEGFSPPDYREDAEQEELAKIDEWVKHDASMRQWDWNRLGHTISRYRDAVRKNPDRAGDRIRLAYAYHLAGFKKHAWTNMQKAVDFISEDRLQQAYLYRRVYRAVRLNAYITGSRVKRPSKPEWFSALYGVEPPMD